MIKWWLGLILVVIGGIVMFAQTQSDFPLSALADCREGRGCGTLAGALIGIVIVVAIVAYGLKLLRGGQGKPTQG